MSRELHGKTQRLFDELFFTMKSNINLGGKYGGVYFEKKDGPETKKLRDMFCEILWNNPDLQKILNDSEFGKGLISTNGNLYK